MSEKPLYTMADFVARYRQLIAEFGESESPCLAAFNKTNNEYKEIYGVYRYANWETFRVVTSKRRAKDRKALTR